MNLSLEFMFQKLDFLKQPFADVLQNRCFQKFHNINRKKPVLEPLFNIIEGLKKLQHQVLSYKYCEIFKNTFFFTEHFRTNASGFS